MRAASILYTAKTMMEIPPEDFSNAPTRLVVRARGIVSEEIQQLVAKGKP